MLNSNDFVNVTEFTPKELNCLASLYVKYSRDTEVKGIIFCEYDSGDFYIEFIYQNGKYDAYEITRGEELKVHSKE